MPETSKENAVVILERVKMKDWVLGTTKVQPQRKNSLFYPVSWKEDTLGLLV